MPAMIETEPDGVYHVHKARHHGMGDNNNCEKEKRKV